MPLVKSLADLLTKWSTPSNEWIPIAHLPREGQVVLILDTTISPPPVALAVFKGGGFQCPTQAKLSHWCPVPDWKG